jgi:solute carrier family 9 (sodium/hydrogen exchanger), member 8
VIVLAVCFLFAYVIKRYRLFYLPESAAVILLGVFVGFLASKLHPSKAELDLMTFQPELFYFGLLPPLVFDAG